MTTADDTTPPAPNDFTTAVAALTNAIRSTNQNKGSDGAEIIAHVLATVAANLGSTSALTSARPGSWEADLVERLVRGTVGWDDEYLMTFRTTPVEIVVNPDEELADLGLDGMYDASREYIGNVITGGRWNGTELPALSDEVQEQIDTMEDLLDSLWPRDSTEYELRFTAAVQTEFERMRTSNPGMIPDQLTVTVRFVGYSTPSHELTEAWTPGLAGQLYQHARETTPLPGADSAPEWSSDKTPGDALLAAGHWPHLRIPELAHYGTPTDTPKENRS